ncbi:MAG: Tat pathway signal protein [Elusimicrobia bacterium]|nr:Tat pathway signal protein [Elusimicrobiota bacterium]
MRSSLWSAVILLAPALAAAQAGPEAVAAGGRALQDNLLSIPAPVFARQAARPKPKAPSPALPKEVIAYMAGRDVRMHHYLWHAVRDGWLAFDAKTQKAIKDMGWEPPRPSLRANGDPIIDNDSGEDFLYMHHHMIAMVNAKLAEVATAQHLSYAKVTSWSQIPAPTDADYPVPPAWDTGDADFNGYLKKVKSDDFFKNTMVPWERDYTDPKKLKTMSLGELGARIEHTIHNSLHMRFCSNPGAIRPDVDSADPNSIDAKWDDPAYDYLGDTYSSQVNPVFWKIHGWVDDRIEDWKKAHGITGEIAWKGTWVGHQDHGDHQKGPPRAGMPPDKQLLGVIATSGVFHHFRDVRVIH